MKNIGLKITIVLILIIQIAFCLKTFNILKPVLGEIIEIKNIPQNHKLIIFSTIVFSIIFLIILAAIIFQLMNKKEKLKIIEDDEEVDKDTVIKQNEQTEKKEKLLKISKKNREIVSRLLQELDSKKDKKDFFEKLLSNLAEEYKIVQGIVFLKDKKDNLYKKAETYAFYSEEEVREFAEEVGISGQVAVSKELLNISDLPDKYITVLSGLGSSSPNHLIIFPILYQSKSIGIIEIATFTQIDKNNEEILINFAELLGDLVEKFR